MREILFRGKAINRDNRSYRTDYKNGDWVYGLLESYKNDYSSATMINEDGVSNIDIDEETLGQYTGIKDKNGIKIFEGDIVKGTITSAWAKEEIVCCIEYQKDSFVCIRDNKWKHKLMFAKNIQIIGNIYDNPELLEGI